MEENSQEKAEKECDACDYEKSGGGFPPFKHICFTPQPESEGVEILKNWKDCVPQLYLKKDGKALDVSYTPHVIEYIEKLLQAQTKQIRREERERVSNLIENAEGQQHDFKSLSSCSRCGKYCHWSEGCDCCVQIDVPALKEKIFNQK